MITETRIGIEIVDGQVQADMPDAQHGSRHSIQTARDRVAVPIGLDQNDSILLVGM
ncbi:hypothetical protein [Natrinema sp. JCM 9743]